ncbi:TPA: hypothetical protein N0F65_001727 [Lagenidium giganteum]|uniref:Uncharacterized protein n=1 Tax=Lagenidium giganteum TaxID=4803 RepID=A0AAV2Z6B2_9STRA|nr:TPA: hypothetical protein N0F65_001727 [Lagenidium giganteum]
MVFWSIIDYQRLIR